LTTIAAGNDACLKAIPPEFEKELIINCTTIYTIVGLIAILSKGLAASSLISAASLPINRQREASKQSRFSFFRAASAFHPPIVALSPVAKFLHDLHGINGPSHDLSHDSILPLSE
jgi:hypothetical protein